MRPIHAFVTIALLFAPGCGGSSGTNSSADMVPGADLMACNQIMLPTAPVTVQAGTGSPPTAAGGTITDGTYVLTAFTDFNAGSGLVGRPTSAILVFSGGTLQGATLNPKGGVDRINATYSLSGTNIIESGTCGDLGSYTGGYTATATGITMFQSAPDLVSTYTRM